MFNTGYPKGGVLCNHFIKIIPNGVLRNYLAICVLYLSNTLLCSSIMWHMLAEYKKIMEL